jgi:hypothetical protein
MAKSASQRRFDKLVTELGELCTANPSRFKIVWGTYFRGWVLEVQRRAAAQRQDAADEPIPAIFGVLARARELARGIGMHAEPSVALSLIHLEHVCSQAVASVTNPKLYRFQTDCTYRIRERFVRNRARD